MTEQTNPKDWLWRLDSIQKEMERLIPASDLRVLFSLKIHISGSSTAELRTFPSGDALFSSSYSVPKYEDPETGALYFDLGQGELPFVVRWGLNEEVWSLLDAMPDAASSKDADGLSTYECLDWCVWRYVKDTDASKPDGAKVTVGEIGSLESAAMETFALTPQTVLSKVGDLSTLHDWPTALFYLAMKRLHPRLEAWGHDTPNHPLDHKPNEDLSTFSELNDRMIFLEPDFRTATVNAFDLFRHIAEGASVNAAGPSDLMKGVLNIADKSTPKDKVDHDQQERWERRFSGMGQMETPEAQKEREALNDRINQAKGVERLKCAADVVHRYFVWDWMAVGNAQRWLPSRIERVGMLEYVIGELRRIDTAGSNPLLIDDIREARRAADALRDTFWLHQPPPYAGQEAEKQAGILSYSIDVICKALAERSERELRATTPEQGTNKKPEGEAAEPYSKPMSLKELAAVFGIHANTMRSWLKNQQVKNRKVSPRRWSVALKDLPSD